MSQQRLNLDPANYRKLAEPFESHESAQAAWDAFTSELYELRNKHRIRDLDFVVELSIKAGDDENECMMSGHIGSSGRALPMAAYRYGEAKAEHESLVEAIAAHGKKLARKFAAKGQ